MRLILTFVFIFVLGIPLNLLSGVMENKVFYLPDRVLDYRSGDMEPKVYSPVIVCETRRDLALSRQYPDKIVYVIDVLSKGNEMSVVLLMNKKNTRDVRFIVLKAYLPVVKLFGLEPDSKVVKALEDYLNIKYDGKESGYSFVCNFLHNRERLVEFVNSLKDNKADVVVEKVE